MSLVIHAGAHYAVVHGRLKSLGRRSVLRKFIYLMASRAHELVTYDEINRHVWDGGEYHPLRDGARLFTNVMRIRGLLEDDGIMETVDGQGYIFRPPANWAFVSGRETSLCGSCGQEVQA